MKPDAMPAGPVKVLELRSVRGTGGGPEKTITRGAAMANPDRVRVTVCYVRDERDAVFGVHERAAALGIDYVEIKESHSFDRRVVPALGALVRARGIEIVHSHDYKTDLLAWWVARSTGVGVMATAHGWTGHSARERLLYYPLDKRLLARFPLVLAVSSEIQRELLGAGAEPHRVRVLLNGIDHRTFRRDQGKVAAAKLAFGLQDGLIAVGAVGRLERQKRFDLLVEAFAAVHREDPRLRLLIAGEGAEREPLEAAVRARNLEGACRLLGHLDDIVTLHHAVDLLVQSSDYEGTPNAVLEAMAFETPVIATDAGGTAEICRPGVDGLVVPRGSVADLIDAVRLTLADPAATRDRVRHARRRIETDLSFEQRCRQLDDLYEGLAAARAAA
jgi:glycosyltransferase involved in cell wall biosynthesis